MLLEVAGLPVGQGEILEVSTQVTISLFASVVVVNRLLLVPALFTPIFHWYDGLAPPLTGVAVKVTEVPAHIVVADAAMVTLTGVLAFTVAVVLAVVLQLLLSVTVTV